MGEKKYMKKYIYIYKKKEYVGEIRILKNYPYICKKKYIQAKT